MAKIGPVARARHGRAVQCLPFEPGQFRVTSWRQHRLDSSCECWQPLLIRTQRTCQNAESKGKDATL